MFSHNSLAGEALTEVGKIIGSFLGGAALISLLWLIQPYYNVWGVSARILASLTITSTALIIMVRIASNNVLGARKIIRLTSWMSIATAITFGIAMETAGVRISEFGFPEVPWFGLVFVVIAFLLGGGVALLDPDLTFG